MTVDAHTHTHTHTHIHVATTAWEYVLFHVTTAGGSYCRCSVQLHGSASDWSHATPHHVNASLASAMHQTNLFQRKMATRRRLGPAIELTPEFKNNKVVTFRFKLLISAITLYDLVFRRPGFFILSISWRFIIFIWHSQSLSQIYNHQCLFWV